MNKQNFRQIIKGVEKKFNRGKVILWKNRDFEDLSFSIHQKTKVLISPATLKRIFGKVKTDENYSPQESTLQALQDFAGIEGNTTKSFKPLWYVISGVAVILLVFFFFIFNNDKDDAHTKDLPPQCSVTLTKTEGICPTTAFFKLGLPENVDSLFIDFGDQSPLIRITNQDIISHFYAYPGQSTAKLKYKKKTIAKSEKILVSTENWQAFASYYYNDYNAESRQRYYPVPIEKGLDDGKFYVSPRTIGSLGIDTTEIITVRLDNYRPTEINGDTFWYSAKIKNSTFWPAIRCYSSMVKIEGTDGIIEFKLVAEGCSSYASYTLGEVHKGGANSDLSQLVFDRYEWAEIKVINKNKEVHLYINGKELLKETYTHSIGDIVGTSIEFHGSGSVDEVSLLVGDQEVFYESF